MGGKRKTYPPSGNTLSQQKRNKGKLPALSNSVKQAESSSAQQTQQPQTSSANQNRQEQKQEFSEPGMPPQKFPTHLEQTPPQQEIPPHFGEGEPQQQISPHFGQEELQQQPGTPQNQQPLNFHEPGFPQPTSISAQQKSQSEVFTLPAQQESKLLLGPSSSDQQGNITPQQQTQNPEKDDNVKPSAAYEEKQLCQIYNQQPDGGFKIPKRPYQPPSEKRGRIIPLEVNYLAMEINKKVKIVNYDVSIEPNYPRKLIMPVMLAFLKRNFPNRAPAFDGMKNLYSSGPLMKSSWLIDIVEISEDGKSTPTTFVVKIKEAAIIDLNDIYTYTSSGTSKEPPKAAIQCLDVVLRHTKNSCFVKVGRSFFGPPAGDFFSLGGGVELWYGQYQSAVMGWKPFVNIDVTHKGFTKGQSIIELINELDTDQECCVANRRPPSKELTASLKNYLYGFRIAYQIPNQASSKRTYRVTSVGKLPDEEKFRNERGQVMSVTQFYAQQKRYRLKYPFLPCIAVKSKEKRMCYPAELCSVIAGQDFRKLDVFQTTNMTRNATTSAGVRKEKIEGIAKQSQYQTDPVVNEFGISISGSLEKVEGRVLVPPKLNYRHGDVEVKNGVWNVGQFKDTKPITRWGIISLANISEQAVVNMYQTFQRYGGKDLGMKINRPLMYEVVNQSGVLNALYHALKNKFQFVLVIINNSGSDYVTVKKAAELDVGIVTQCIKKNNVERMNCGTAKMILQKINSKLNGVNHTLSIESRPACLMRPCMIVGADVTHPAPGMPNQPSIAALTASFEPGAFKFRTALRLQHPMKEIIEDMAEMMKEQLVHFRRMTNQKPEKIIIFRDGVSEGQFEHVLNAELTRIRQACRSLEEHYQPAVTIIIVQKRHHTRFFPCNPKDQDKNQNAPAGTCVDTIITHPTELDFFLLSHASEQGTARPTRYHCLWDDSSMKEDEIEHLAYYLCHLYTRCTRVVSYPAPTYYAHWAAARAHILVSHIPFNLTTTEDFQRFIPILQKFVDESPMFFV